MQYNREYLTCEQLADTLVCCTWPEAGREMILVVRKLETPDYSAGKEFPQ